jgi:hypothetical protein
LQHAVRYRVEVSENENFSSLIEEKTSETLTMNLPVSMDIKSIYVRVKAFGENIPDSDYSNVVYLERKNHKNTFIGIAAIVFAFIAL